MQPFFFLGAILLELPPLGKELTPSPCIPVTSNDVYCENSKYEVQLTLIKSPVPMELSDLYTDILEYPGARGGAGTLSEINSVY